MNSSRKIAVDILEQVLSKGAYSNIVLNLELNKSNLNEKDKALVTEIVYGTIKYKYTIDKILKVFIKEELKNLDKIILNILRSTIYQIKYLDKIPEFAAVNEAVELAKKFKSIGASKFVNGVLRNYIRNKDVKPYKEENIVERLSFLHSYEPWMVKLFISQYGEAKAACILSELNKTPKVTVRVNSIKTNYDSAMEKLAEGGYDVEEGYICPEAIKINKGRSIESNPLFREGLISVQDESAMLIAPSLEINKEMNVFDLCSAPGGKAAHIAEIMNNTGKVYAFDIHENKLSLIKDNIDRLGITNIKCDVMDASKLNRELINKADRVLIDVPCSGLGIIRKKPEIKWTKNSKALNELVTIQRDIMECAAEYVKEDGIIIYSTCTLNKAENEENVRWFLKKFSNFKLEPLYYGKVDNIIYDKDGFVTILPNNAMDGFFMAKFKKIR